MPLIDTESESLNMRCATDLAIPEIIQIADLRGEYEMILCRQFQSGKLGINCCQNSVDCGYLTGDLWSLY